MSNISMQKYISIKETVLNILIGIGILILTLIIYPFLPQDFSASSSQPTIFNFLIWAYLIDFAYIGLKTWYYLIHHKSKTRIRNYAIKEGIIFLSFFGLSFLFILLIKR